MKTRLILLIGMICLPVALLSATFTVTHTLDSGVGSFREALTLANANAENDTIEFQISTNDINYNALLQVWTIKPDSALPVISTDGVFINGFSQLGSFQMAIELNGYNISGTADALAMTSANNKIQGLSIGGFHGNAIKIVGASAMNNEVYGCYLGLKLPGSKDDGYKDLSDANYSVIDSRGIYIGEGASSNIIGGEAEWQRNVISYNYYEGILISAGANNTIVNNYIGTAANGVDAMGNGWINVFRYRPDEMLVDRCPAIRISNGSIYNIIGGDTGAARNVICGSGNAGVILQDAETSYNIIKANYVGLGTDGVNHVYSGNTNNGVLLRYGASENQIGGGLEGQANYISANASHGIMLLGLAMNNIISGNYVGLDGTASTVIPNELNGIHLEGTSSLGSPQANLIGPDNTVSGNLNYGIYIAGSNTTKNTITENSVSLNTMGGIQLISGGNTELVAPIISSTGNQVNGTTIANGKVEFFSADGVQFLGSKIADVSGNFTWDSGAYTDPVIATVTDSYGNTSEFSNSVALPVEFAAFSAAFDKGYVVLNWSTESESNNFGFYIERKVDTWESIGFVPGTGTTNEQSTYEFIDEEPSEGDVAYRLRQVDFDGAVSYSHIVTAANVTPNTFYLDNPYPNPFNMELSFVIGIAREARVQVQVYNTLGQRVRVLADQLMTVGEHRLHWNGFSDEGAVVPSGLYFIRMQTPGFSKTKQVLLIK